MSYENSVLKVLEDASSKLIRGSWEHSDEQLVQDMQTTAMRLIVLRRYIDSDKVLPDEYFDEVEKEYKEWKEKEG